MTVQDTLDRILDDNESEDGDVIIHPPSDSRQSDEESGDEEVVNPGHMTRGQLTAETEVQRVNMRSQDIAPVSDECHFIPLLYICY